MKRKIDYALVKKEFDERNYELISKEYINNITKLKYICPKHKDKGVQEITFANFTKGRGCPYCAHRIRKTQEEYVKELEKAKPDISVIGEYTNLKTKIKHKCKICNFCWDARPDNLLYGKNGCPKCGKRLILTKEDVIKRLKVDNTIELIGDYINTSTKTLFKCKQCNYVWEAKPNNIFNGKGCPRCKSSKGEKEISKCLEAKSVFYIREHCFSDCYYEAKLPFDFYIPSYNLCIEYDGIQHFEPCTFGGISLKKAKENLHSCKIRDSIKTSYCEQHGIKLLRIPYTEFNNINKIISSIIN